jgi:hypothetical protein
MPHDAQLLRAHIGNMSGQNDRKAANTARLLLDRTSKVQSKWRAWPNFGLRWQAQRDTALDFFVLASSYCQARIQSAVAASLCRRTAIN